MTFETAQTILKNNEIKDFIDVEFPPNDTSIFSENIDKSVLETIIHWRRPKDFMELGSLEDSLYRSRSSDRGFSRSSPSGARGSSIKTTK